MKKKESYYLMREQLKEWMEDSQWIIEEDYIIDKEYYECVKDIFQNKAFQSMNQFIQHGNTSTRAHCIQVSYLAYHIAKEKGLDYVSTARAGLLHDLFLYDWHTHAKETGNRFHGFTHPKTALKNSEKEFNLNDIERNGIVRHMWPLTPIPPKYKEAFLVSYADKYCTLAEVFTQWKERAVQAMAKLTNA